MKEKGSVRSLKQYNPIRKIRVALAGLWYCIVLDFSVSWKFFLSIVVLILAFLYEDSWVNFLFIMSVTALMIIAEMFNSVAEALCDLVQPELDARVKVIKDMAAAAAGIAIFVWLFVLVHVLCEIFF